MNHSCLKSNSENHAPPHIVGDMFVRKMNGGSQSALIGASDGNFYVLKLANNPQGPNTLFNEACGTILSQYLGLPVPDWCPIYMDQEFILANPGLSFATETGSCAPSPGLHFGSRFLRVSPEDEVYEVVPHKWMGRVRNPQFFGGMFLLDVWAENVDRRQVFFIERSMSRALDVLFFDFGHMFSGPHGRKQLKSAKGCLYEHRNVYTTAFEAAAIEDWLQRIESLNESTLKALMDAVPREWCNSTIERDTISLLMRNQGGLKYRVNEVARGLRN